MDWLEPLQWERVQEALEPLIFNPLAAAAALLTLMLLLAVLAYRRNQRDRRSDDMGLASQSAGNDKTAATQAPSEPTLSKRGLQADILALDLDLNGAPLPIPTPVFAPSPPPALSPSVAPVHSAVEPVTASVPSAEDLNLSKLQLAQKLLAAGENELARVLLTSVAESLQNQLQQPGDSTPGSHP